MRPALSDRNVVREVESQYAKDRASARMNTQRGLSVRHEKIMPTIAAVAAAPITMWARRSAMQAKIGRATVRSIH